MSRFKKNHNRFLIFAKDYLPVDCRYCCLSGCCFRCVNVIILFLGLVYTRYISSANKILRSKNARRAHAPDVNQTLWLKKKFKNQKIKNSEAQFNLYFLSILPFFQIN